MSLALINIIFGMKVRQARTEAGLTLTEFAAQCDLSPSYVTEIEKGRKYPRADKIMKMAETLGKSYDDLVSIRLSPSLSYLETTISSSAFQRFPFEEFGLEAGDLVTLLTREPEKASALIHAILEIGRRYDLKEEDFLRAALRSYQEIHENYFPELEDAALAFTQAFETRYAIGNAEPVSQQTLETILRDEYGYTINYTAVADSAELSHYRSIFIRSKSPRLYINGNLYARQIKFILARELGYCYLDLKERSTESTPDRVDTFQQLLNDFKAAYFGGALLMPRARFLDDLKAFFAMPQWDPRPFAQMLTTYNVTPEMLLYRFSELIPQFFGIKLHFLRFHHELGSGTFQLIKQLNMNRLLVPSGIGLYEHYCRRWLSVTLFDDLAQDAPPLSVDDMPVGVQYSEFLDSKDRFLCMGYARRMVLSPDVYSSVIVGFRVDADLPQTIRFTNDPTIPHVIINETCERCPLAAEQCQRRVAAPTLLREAERAQARKVALNLLREIG